MVMNNKYVFINIILVIIIMIIMIMCMSLFNNIVCSMPQVQYTKVPVNPKNIREYGDDRWRCGEYVDDNTIHKHSSCNFHYYNGKTVCGALVDEAGNHIYIIKIMVHVNTIQNIGEANLNSIRVIG